MEVCDIVVLTVAYYILLDLPVNLKKERIMIGRFVVETTLSVTLGSYCQKM